MGRQDYTGGDRGQQDRQADAAREDNRPDVDFGGGNVFVGGAGSGGESQEDYNIRTDPRNSERYQNYLNATGRNLSNPFGDTNEGGIFSSIFNKKDMSFFDVNNPLQKAQAQQILDAGFRRYENFNRLSAAEQRRGFGSLFGDSEGEMTAQGEVREQVTPMSTSEMAARLAGTAAGLGAPLSMIPGDNIGYAPMGSSGYDPQLDPQVNPDLKSGPFSLLTGGVNIPEAFGRAKDFITSKLSPAEELAAQTRTQARGPELSELSQTVSGGRFENESAIKRPLSTTIPTQKQESLTFDGSIENSQREDGLRDNPNLVADASDLLPNVFDIIQQGDVLNLNNLLEDGTLYETESGNKLQFGVEDGGPKLTYKIPFSLTT